MKIEYRKSQEHATLGGPSFCGPKGMGALYRSVIWRRGGLFHLTFWLSQWFQLRANRGGNSETQGRGQGALLLPSDDSWMGLKDDEFHALRRADQGNCRQEKNPTKRRPILGDILGGEVLREKEIRASERGGVAVVISLGEGKTFGMAGGDMCKRSCTLRL